MTERPILFNGPMVRAILDGRKTMTRRIVKAGTRDDWNACPYGVIGDRLWVRETWRCFGGREYEYQQHQPSIIYRADDGPTHNEGGWRPSIFMPRWASRITLEITGVRVERLQDISEADAEAEGCTGDHRADRDSDAAQEFRSLWNQINGKRASWDSNPWVWVVEFRRAGATSEQY